MKIELYEFAIARRRFNGRTGGRFWRWRINDDAGIVIAQGMVNHKTREDAQRELDGILDFLEAWSRERVMHGAAR